MAVDQIKYRDILNELGTNIKLVAVSKTKPVEDIQALYDLGQRDFGENYVQELVDKVGVLPADIRWHFIGHLQTNKVKYLVPFVYMIQGVDSLKLLLEIDKQAARQNKTIFCLLQVHIAQEETKFGFDETELDELIKAFPEHMMNKRLTHVKIAGLMGMASFTEDQAKLKTEFLSLKNQFDKVKSRLQDPEFDILSMGMSSDYALAKDCGSNMVRIGSLLFGKRA